MKQLNKNLKYIRVTIAELSQQKLAKHLAEISASSIAAYEDRDVNVPMEKIATYKKYCNEKLGTNLNWDMLLEENLEEKGKDYVYTGHNQNNEKIEELRELVNELSLNNTKHVEEKKILHQTIRRHETTLDTLNLLVQDKFTVE